LTDPAAHVALLGRHHGGKHIHHPIKRLRQQIFERDGVHTFSYWSEQLEHLEFQHLENVLGIHFLHRNDGPHAESKREVLASVCEPCSV
jgi:hypothetical protein